MTDHFDISTRGDTNSTRQAGTSDAERLATAAVKLREVEGQRDALIAAFAAIEDRLVTILRDQDVPLYACRYCNRIGADHAANVEHAEWCLITTARAALSATPAELLAQREREQAALALLREYRASFQGIGLPGSEQGALERRLFAAVDGLGEAKGETNAVPS